MANAQAPVVLTNDQFLQATKAKTTRIGTQAVADSNRMAFRLPQAGMANTLFMYLTGTITVGGTITGGTISSHGILDIIKRMRLQSTSAFNLRDMSGWAWYKWLRGRQGYDPLTGLNGSLFSTNSIAALGLNRTSSNLVPGANVAAGTYTVNLALPMPVSYNDSGETGLLILQNNAQFYDFWLDFGMITSGVNASTSWTNDLFTGVTGSGMSVSMALTASLGMEYYEIPNANLGKMTGMFMSVNNVTTSPLLAGENIIRPPLSDLYTYVQHEVINNALPVPVLSFSNLTWQHSGNVIDHQDDYVTRMLLNTYKKSGLPPIDGTIEYDLGIRRGQYLRRDTYDAFDDRNVTDLLTKFTLPSTTTITNGYIDSVYESLRFIQQ